MARLQAYLENVGSPFSTGSDICNCDALTPQILGDFEDEPDRQYDTPATDPAPWYDEDVTVSGDFLGFLPTSVSGTTNNPYTRTVTNAVGGGGVFGPRRAGPRTITVTGLLVGSTCCAVEYGMHWLAEALAGCSGSACDGDCFTLYDCCPEPGDDPDEFNQQHRRTFRRVALVDGPREINRAGSPDCGRGQCSGGEIVEVEFTLVAATPWAWTETEGRLNIELEAEPTDDCVEWCATSSGPNCQGEPCAFAACRDGRDPCADPRNPVPRPPQPSLPEASFCVPFAPDIQCFELDLSTRPDWSDDAVTVTLMAGVAPLRNVRVVMYEKRSDDPRDCDTIADEQRCFPANEFVVTYVPAGGAVVIDGQTGGATTQCFDVCQTASTVFGDQDGGPLEVNPLTCAMYCVCIETDSVFPPARGSRVIVSTSGRGY